MKEWQLNNKGRSDAILAVNPIKVLIVDDSALVRQVLTKIFAQDKNIEVIGTAVDPLFAIKKIKEQRPDVITLDLEMPRMDGLTFLERLMAVYPMPVVVISSLAKAGAAATIKALELGAVDFVTKPSAGLSGGLENLSREILAKVKSAAAVNMDQVRRQVKKMRVGDRVKTEPSPEISTKKPLVSSTDKIIAIGASTGGTVAVKQIISRLPANLPGILIVLHMPAGFTASYAESLNTISPLRIKEATDRESLVPGSVFIAAGGKHMVLEKGSGGFTVRTDNSEPVNRHRPSVDKLFFSVAQNASPNSLGIILTGMGDDGARGLKEMHDKGSPTIAQNEQSSIVFGMPRQAIELGAVDRILSLEDISSAIVGFVNG